MAGGSCIGGDRQTPRSRVILLPTHANPAAPAAALRPHARLCQRHEPRAPRLRPRAVRDARCAAVPLPSPPRARHRLRLPRRPRAPPRRVHPDARTRAHARRHVRARWRLPHAVQGDAPGDGPRHRARGLPPLQHQLPHGDASPLSGAPGGREPRAPLGAGQLRTLRRRPQSHRACRRKRGRQPRHGARRRVLVATARALRASRVRRPWRCEP